MLNSNLMRIMAWLFWVLAQAEQSPDVFNRKAKVTSVANKREAAEPVCCVAPLITFRAFWRINQAHLFVISNGGNLHACAVRKLTYRKHQKPLEPIAARGIIFCGIPNFQRKSCPKIVWPLPPFSTT